MINATRLTIFLFSMLLAAPASSQERLNLQASCHYYGEATSQQLWTFATDQEAEFAVKRVLDHTGLPQNFEVMRGNVPNAMAAIEAETRYIVYNQAFIERVKETTRTDWAAISILAHEIGHHLAGHTLRKDGSRPKSELEADRFSGHVLYKMGSAMEDAKAAMITVASETGSATHPPKSARIAAIESGWFDARDQSGGSKPHRDDTSTAPPRTQTPPPSQGPRVVAECHFNDGGVAYLRSDNTIWMNYLGTQFQVATRTASDDPRFAWYYTIQSADPSTEAMLQLFGMSGATRYGVDRDGAIWSANLLGQCCVQIGQVRNR